METIAREERRMLPGDLTIDPVYDVRPGDAVDKDIETLAADIEANGQLDHVILESRSLIIDNTLAGYEEQLVIVAGHRRVQAISLLNARRVTLDPPEPLLEVLCLIDYSITSPAIGLRKAIASNLQRKNYNPMQIALLIDRIRKENEFDQLPKTQATKAVADYLNVSTATVTQHAKFLTAPEEVKHGLATGEMSADYALTLLTAVKEEKKAEVVEKSREIQAKKESKKQQKPAVESIEKLAEPEDTAPVHVMPNGAVKGNAKPKPSKIERSSLNQAIRETPGASDTPIPVTRKEIIAFIQDIDSPAYGYPNSPARVWSRYMTEKFLPGIGTDTTASKKFDAMIDVTLRGDESSEKAEKVEEPVAAGAKKKATTAAPKPSSVSPTGKTTRKDAGKPKKHKSS